MLSHTERNGRQREVGGSYAGENDAMKHNSDQHGVRVARIICFWAHSHKYIFKIIMYLRGAFPDDDSFSFACLWLCIKLLWLPSASRVTVLAIHGSGSTMLLCVLDVDVESDATSLLQSDREQCTTCINYREH